jgi:hypothetical protein
MSGSKQIANIRDQLAALENTPAPQSLTEANPITQGISNMLRGAFKSAPKLKPNATINMVDNATGKAVEYRLVDGDWFKFPNGKKTAVTHGSQEALDAEAAALKKPGNLASSTGVVGKTFEEAWADPEIKRKIMLNGIDYAQKMPWAFVRIGSGMMAGVNLVEFLRAMQNNDTEKFWSSGGDTLFRAMGIFFPKTEIGLQLAMWAFRYGYEQFQKEKFTEAEEKFVQEEAKKLYLAGTPPDPQKIDAKYFPRIKNDYERWQKQKPIGPGAAGPSGAPAPAPAASETPNPSAASAAPAPSASTAGGTPTAAPTSAAPSGNEAEELRAMLKAAGLGK